MFAHHSAVETIICRQGERSIGANGPGRWFASFDAPILADWRKGNTSCGDGPTAAYHFSLRRYDGKIAAAAARREGQQQED
jgi:hypothetical protein